MIISLLILLAVAIVAISIILAAILADTRDGMRAQGRRSRAMHDDAMFEIGRFESKLKNIAEEASHAKQLLRIHEKEQLELAGGGTWRTQSGHHVRIRDMSTNHLQNTLKMFAKRSRSEPFLSMQRELARRDEDKMWQGRTEIREAQQKTKLAAALDAMAGQGLKPEQTEISKNPRECTVLEKLNDWLKKRPSSNIVVGQLRRKITLLLQDEQ